MNYDEMGAECSTHWKLGIHTKLKAENQKVRDHLRTLGVDGKIILKRILAK